MLQNMQVVAGQVLMLFIMMAVGWFGAKKKLLTDAGADQLTWLSFNIVTPCVIINSLQREKDPALMLELGITIAAMIVLILGTTLVSALIFRKGSEKDTRVLRFAISYPNAGYMGIPLVQAVLGDGAVVYAAGAVIAFQLCLWTSGVVLAGGRSEMSLKKAVLNPGILGFVVAFFLFGFEIMLPTPIGGAIKMFADMNTPIAMLIIGIFIASTNLKTCFTQGKLYLISGLRLLLFPAILLVLLYPLNLRYEVYAAIIITGSAPTAAVTGMFASRYKLNTGMASQSVTLCTLLSIVTMPLFAALVRMLVG